MIDIMGHVSYIFIVLGMALLARGRTVGFLFQSLGAFIWMICGIFLGLSSMIIWNTVLVIIGIYGYVKLLKARKTS